MKLVVKTGKCRNNGVGDYFEKRGTFNIVVAPQGIEAFEWLLFIHEAVEMLLAKHRGIPFKDIDTWDKEFEKRRQEGNLDEPGSHALSPYRKEHEFAESIERLFAHELGVDWTAYSKFLDES